ncbi:MAG: cupin domain-containing protein [Pseudomonadota bacterium]
MSELFVDPSLNGLDLPRSGSVLLAGTDTQWQDCGAEGFWIKPLLQDEGSQLRTWLMKVDAGAFSPMHAHEEIEQIYVLEGSFYDQDHQYQAGDYIVRAAGAMHTAGSEDGAIVLLFYSEIANIAAK